MKAREIILLVLILAAGIFFTHARMGKLHIDFDWEDYVALDWNAFTFEESQVIEAPLPSFLKVANSHGSVEIQGTTEDKMTLTLKKKIWRRNEEKARQVAENLHPIVAREDSSLTISTNREDFKKRNFETSFLIICPENMEVEVRTSYGLAKVQAVGKSAIRNRHGKVVASDVRGELWLDNSYEPVELKNIQSLCQVKSRHANIKASSVKGEMTIENSHGRIELQDIAGKVALDGRHNEIHAEGLGGPVEIQNSYGKISLARVRSVDVQARHCPVEIDDVSGNVRIRNDYAKVKLNEIRGNVWISGKNLAVLGRAIVGEEIYASSSYDNVELTDFSGKTTVLVSHGKVSLSPLPLTAPIEVRCDYSPVTLYWPPNEENPLEAQTKNGHIFWRLPGQISINEENRLTVARAYSELKDRPGIYIQTTYADIQIEKGVAR